MTAPTLSMAMIIKVAIGKYGNTLVKTAVDLYKLHNAANGNKWSQPLNGGMILGLSGSISLP